MRQVTGPCTLAGVGACATGCAARWEQCGGTVELQACCNAEDHCIARNDFYAQCRPKSEGLPTHWEIDVMSVQVLTCDGVCRCQDHQVCTPPSGDPCLLLGCKEHAVGSEHDRRTLNALVLCADVVRHHAARTECKLDLHSTCSWSALDDNCLAGAHWTQSRGSDLEPQWRTEQVPMCLRCR